MGHICVAVSRCSQPLVPSGQCALPVFTLKELQERLQEDPKLSHRPFFYHERAKKKAQCVESCVIPSLQKPNDNNTLYQLLYKSKQALLAVSYTSTSGLMCILIYKRMSGAVSTVSSTQVCVSRGP